MTENSLPSAANLKSVSVWNSPWSGICFASTCWRNPQSCSASATTITGLKLSDVVAPLPLSHSLPRVHRLRSALTLSLLFALLRSTPSPSSCQWVRFCWKQMNVFILATCQWFWEVISLNTAVTLFIFVTFCSPLHSKVAGVGGLCLKILLVPHRFLFRPLWLHIFRMRK